jgi:thiol-disulfide isomerase/thioredoxin
MNMTRWTILVSLSLVLVGVRIALAGPEGTSDHPHASETMDPAATPAPDVRFTTLEGEEASLADYRDMVILLNIWGTWCPPCIEEIPHLVGVQKVIEPRGATVIGLAVDSGSSDDIHAFWQDRLNLDPAYPLWMGTNRTVRRHFQAFGLPNTLIIDGDGVIRERFLGLMTRDMLLEALEPYL